MSSQISRRTLLRTAVTVAGAAVAAPLLSACGSGGAAKSGSNSKAGLAGALPAFVASTAVTADIPSVTGPSGGFSDPGFLTYPAAPVKTVTKTPGSGGSYSAVTPLWGTIPAADNPFYQAVNAALGVKLTMQPANGTTYNTAIPTLTAAQKLPDWVQLPTWWNALFNVGGLVGTQLADLTPYLAGDKIKEYPNLAALPTGAWQAGVWGDKLYGIPSFASGTAFAGAFFYRRDVFEAKGIAADSVKSADDLMNLGKELTSASAGVWAFDDMWTYLTQPFGIAQLFTAKDGKLVHKYEQPEYLEALNWAWKLAKSGYIHPDALAGNNNDAKARFYAGKVLVTGDGTGSWNMADAQAGQAADPKYRRGALPLFAADGTSAPSIFLGSSTSLVSYLNAKLKPEQIKELLAVANYFAAPWGSAEYTLINYGVEGVDHTRVDGTPTFTPAGQKSVQQQTYPFLVSSPQATSNPGFDQITKDRTAWEAQAVKYAYKPVFWNMNITVPSRLATAGAAQALEDTVKDVQHGLKTVADYQNALTSWKRSGGDELTAWYQSEIYDKQGSGQ
ncbi:ABC transporter substrate-binding protein [Kitasatospora indigofera]|uniref:ABC transporter substrate-binding protein n=1 Tax=Kitasatospora indigofera TaxID=67307 RepID=UPI00364B3251